MAGAGSESPVVVGKLLYVPVYVNTYEYRGKTYKTYISGTTGKVVGKPPKTIWSFFKKLVKFLGVAAVTAAICYYCL